MHEDMYDHHYKRRISSSLARYHECAMFIDRHCHSYLIMHDHLLYTNMSGRTDLQRLAEPFWMQTAAWQAICLNVMLTRIHDLHHLQANMLTFSLIMA